MNPNDPRIDRAVADALRASGAEPYDGSLDALAARIEMAASPIFSARRHAVKRGATWFDFTAGWARTLVPTGFAIGAASLLVLWLIARAPAAETPAPPQPSAILAVVGHVASATAVVDRAVDDLVNPTIPPIQRTRR